MTRRRITLEPWRLKLLRGTHRKRLPQHGRRLRFEPLEDRQLLATLTVNSPLDIKVAGDGLVTLREAIIAANTNTTTDLGQTGSGSDTIEFAPSVSGTIALTFGEMIITQTLTINGPGRDVLTIDAQQNSRIFNLMSTATNSSIRGLTLTGGHANGDGGGVYGASSVLSLDQMAIISNTASGKGGGVYTAGGLTITSSIVSGNTTTGAFSSGGGFYSNASASVTNCTISDNRTNGSEAHGGGFVAGINVSLNDSHVTNNQVTSGRGGGFRVVQGGFPLHGGYAFVNNSTITGNTAISGGGFESRFAAVTNSLITHNHAATIGGGFSITYKGLQGDALTIAGSNVSYNSAGTAGGGFHIRYDGTVGNTTVSGNSGGGIHLEPAGNFFGRSLTLNSSTIRNNVGTGILTIRFFTPISGGGVTLNSSIVMGNRGGGISTTDDVILNNSIVSANWDGAGIGSGGDVIARSSTISGNSGGDGISAYHVTLESTTISGNSATSGGGIVSRGATIKHSTITRNFANSGVGGGVWNLSGPVEVVASILAGNFASGVSQDLSPGPGMLMVNSSLIGDNAGTGLMEAQTPDANGNLIGSAAGGGVIDPRLGPLADNGGPTQAHALLPGSPAIDAIPISAGPPPTHDFQLNGSLSGSTGGPNLVAMGGALTATGYDFGPNQGLNLSSALANPAQYSIELSFRWDSLSGGWQKIIDLHNLTSDVGLYTASNGLHFLNRAFAANLFTPNTMHRVVLTRDDATDIVRGYVDGDAAWNFVDSAGEAVFDAANQIIRFFQDDNATGQSEAQGGFVDLIRIYNQVLTAAEVSALQALPVVGVPTFDQRGNPFVRIANGDGVPGSNIDMGAYESQGVPSFSPGDYNQNGIVDAADYVLWRKGLGTTYTPNDYVVWRSNFGRLLVIASPGTSSLQTESLIASGEAARHVTVVESAAPVHSATAIDLVRFEQTSRLSEGGFRASGAVASSYNASVSGGLASSNGQLLLLASSYDRGVGWNAVIHEVASRHNDAHSDVTDQAFAGVRSDRLRWAYIAEGLFLSDA